MMAMLGAAARRAGSMAVCPTRASAPAARQLSSAADPMRADVPAAEPAPFSFTPAGKNHLFVPGPTNINDRVQRAMIRAGQNHRDANFAHFARPLIEDLKYLFRTEVGQPFVFPATGTGAWESGLCNTLSPGDKIVIYRNGTFSHLWTDMCERLGLDVHVLETKWGEGPDEQRLAEVLQADGGKEIKAVCVVQNETATGCASDIPSIRRVLDEFSHPALLMVDGVSSVGAMDCNMDEWGIDVIMTGSQKALSLPPGLGLVCASPKAMAMRESAKLNRVFFSWDDMLKMYAVGNFPYTPAIPLLYGLRESLDMCMEEGLENVIARHARFAEGTRRAVKGWGLELLCKNPRFYSNALTVVEAPEGVNSADIVKTAYSKYNLSIGVGLMKVEGKVFRIGHLGDMNEVSLLGAIAGVEMALLDVGADIKPGSGVGAAVQYFKDTSSVIPTREMPGVH